MVALNRALLLLGAVCLLCVSQLCSATEYDHRVRNVTFFHDLVSCSPPIPLILHHVLSRDLRP